MNKYDFIKMQIFKKQDEALAYMKQENHKILTKIGDTKFITFETQEDFISKLEETQDENTHFNEVLQADEPQKMFSDVDGEKLGANKIVIYDQWEILMKDVFKRLGMEFDKSNVKIVNSTGDQMSGHWLYDDGKAFENCVEQKEFWTYVKTIIQADYPDLCFIKSSADKLKIKNDTVLDLSSYSKNRAMRTIYQTKVDSDRVLLPIRIKNKKIKELKNVDIEDYLIFAPNATDFYKLEYPEHTVIKNKKQTKSSIEKIILDNVPDVRIKKIKGSMFILENTTACRKCIINGEENKSDNSYVVWKSDGLYFGCHDEGCAGQLKHIWSTKVETPALSWNAIESIANEADTKEKITALKKLIVNKMNEEWTYVKSTNSFLIKEFDSMDDLGNIKPEIMFKNIKGMKGDFSNKKIFVPCDKVKAICPYECWMEHRSRKEVDKIVFYPKSYLENKHLPNVYNLFKGFQIPQDEVNDLVIPDNFEEQGYFKHILHRWCLGNLDVYKKVLDIFAHILQKPWEKLNLCIVLKSKQRTGKGIILEIFKEILGAEYYFQPSGADEVLGNFNSGMSNKLILFMDEMVWGGDKQASGTLKKLITEKKRTIKTKNISNIEVDNLINVFMASNEQWVIPAGQTEARFLVLDVLPELAEMTDKKQKKKIIKDIASIDRKLLAKFLYTRNLSKFNHRETIITDGLRDQQVESMCKLHKWWLEALTNGSINSDTQTIDLNGSHIEKSHMFQSYKTHSGDRHMVNSNFWKNMKGFVGEDYKRMRNEHQKRPYYINLASLETLRDNWRTQYADPAWPFPEEDDYDGETSEGEDLDE